MNIRGSNALQRLGRQAVWALVLVLGLLAPGLTLRAQVDQGSIAGTITDSEGGVIPNADVTITNIDTGFTLQDHTDGKGVYTFSPLKIGNYTVKATAPGFATTQQDKVVVNVGERATIDVKLNAGAVSEVVEVTTAAPLLQTSDGSTGQVVSAQTIVDTPLNGRNYVFIAQLSAGIAPGNGSRGAGKGDFSANGQRAEQNNFILDGVDNNVNVVDFFNGASYNVKPPPEALAEFKVQTGAYSAEYGHSAGAVINVSVKSGTNQFHGSAWEYVRNDAFDIHEWSSFGNRTVPKYRQNQFGATIGGPVFKDKLFLFGDFEMNRIIFGESGTITVPTLLMRQGNFSELLNATTAGSTPIQLVQPNSADSNQKLANNTLLPSQINPTALKILNLFPTPNAVNPTGAYTNNYFSSRNAVDNTTQFDVRMDYNATQKDQAFVRASYSNDPGSRAPILGSVLDGGGFGDTGTIVNLGEALAASETHIFNANLSNEARFGYNYGNFGFLQPNSDNTGLAASIGLGGIPGGAQNGGLPNVGVSGIAGFGSPTFAVTNEYQNVFQILDNVTKVAGNHTLRMGVNFQHIRFSTTQPTQPRGSYTYSGKFTAAQGSPNIGGVNYSGFGVADFLTNNQDSAALSNIFTSDDVRWVRAGYVQDDWKVSPKLVMNLGIRYEYSQPYEERHDNQAAFTITGFGPSSGTGLYLIPSSKQNVALSPIFTNTLAANHIAIQYTGNRFLVNPQQNNVAPRFGLAYKVNEKLVVRSGYGIFFGGLESTGYYPNLGENYPFEYDANYSSQTLYGSCTLASCRNNGISLENGFSTAIAAGLQNSIANPGLRGSDASVKTPYSQQYNLSTEYAINNTLSAGLAYVGSVSRHLVVFPDLNSPTALVNSATDVTPYRSFPTIGGDAYSSYIGSSNYNSLQAKLDQRFNTGLSYLASYTYAHSLDNAPTPLGVGGDSGYRNPVLLGIGADYSNSPNDVRQRFTLNGSYQLPYGVGRRFGNHHGIADIVLGGWTNSLTFIAQTGSPFTLNTSITTVNGAGAHPIRVGDPYGTASANGCSAPAKTRTTNNWYNGCAYINPPGGNSIAVGQTVTGLAALAYLGAPRNTLYGPGYERINGSLFKNFSLYRETNFQLRADYFNLLNTPAYGLPNGNISGANAGQITGARSLGQFYPDSRFFQFAAKFNF